MSTPTVDLSKYGIHGSDDHPQVVYRNPSRAFLYEAGIEFEEGTAISSTGALIARSGTKTGRSPSDKRIVNTPEESKDVFWESNACIQLDEHSFAINKERAVDYINTCPRLFVIDAFAGWDPENRLKVRIVCARAYHALFMTNMLITPTAEQLAEFGEPDVLVLNAGQFPANRLTKGMSSKASVDLNLKTGELVILGSQYAGEMKKGVFSFMHWLMPKKGYVSMHASANRGENGDTAVFFGLSGTGKTTLSADMRRQLIGDDEHVWTDSGLFNIEGGCYAKCENLSAEDEPEIFGAIRFGSVLENVVYNPVTREVDYTDVSITRNTRCSYPIEYIPNARVPCVGEHPKNIIFLTCDAFGVLPPVSKLSHDQAKYHFITGYTALVAGTEMGVTEPKATFSACFGEAFIVRHPAVYADLLAAKMEKHNTNCWLVNTGWTGGAYGTGKRMKLKLTRAIIDAIHDGSLAEQETKNMEVFDIGIPVKCNGVPDDILFPRTQWADKNAYDATLKKLAGLFQKNFEKFAAGSSEAIRNAGPKV